MDFTMTKIVMGLVLAAAATGAQSAPVSSGGVLTRYSQAGLDTSGAIPGTSAHVISVDSTITGFVDYSAGTWGVASTTPFFGLVWTASGGSLIKTAGTYSLNTVTGAIGTAVSCTVTGDGSLCFTLGASQLAGAINYAYGGDSNVRIVNVWNINPNGSLTAVVVPGTENGAFIGMNNAFDLTAANLAPVPEASTYAMMLAGLGLVGFMARRRKA